MDDIHEGLKAKNEAKKNKQKGKVQNIAYIGAMRELQDNFYEKVAMRSGLTRLGPARTRDTRQVWKAKQQNAEALAKKLKAIEDTKKVAASGYRAGVKGSSGSPSPGDRDRRPGTKESQGVGKLVGRSSQWLARAKRESQGRGYQGQGRGSKGSGRGPESPRRCRKGQGKGEEGSRPEGRHSCQPTDRRANQNQGFRRRVEEGTGAGERPCQEVGTLRRPNQRNRPQRRGQVQEVRGLTSL